MIYPVDSVVHLSSNRSLLFSLSFCATNSIKNRANEYSSTLSSLGVRKTSQKLLAVRNKRSMISDWLCLTVTNVFSSVINVFFFLYWSAHLILCDYNDYNTWVAIWLFDLFQSHSVEMWITICLGIFPYNYTCQKGIISVFNKIRIPPSLSSQRRPEVLTISPDGNSLAFGSDKVYLWSSKSQKVHKNSYL